VSHNVIELEVDEETARRFRKAAPEERATYGIVLSSLIKRPMERREAAILLGDVMDEISRNAEARGMTPEILEDILRD
jgi:hypothetical protein